MYPAPRIVCLPQGVLESAFANYTFLLALFEQNQTRFLPAFAFCFRSAFWTKSRIWPLFESARALFPKPKADSARFCFFAPNLLFGPKAGFDRFWKALKRFLPNQKQILPAFGKRSEFCSADQNRDLHRFWKALKICFSDQIEFCTAFQKRSRERFLETKTAFWFGFAGSRKHFQVQYG